MRIKQCRTSYSIRFFEPDFLQHWGLVPYTDPDAPAVFFGCYRDPDYNAILEHRALAVVVWGGSDTMTNIERLEMLNKPNIYHISGSRWITDDLERAGLSSKFLPISCVDRSRWGLRPVPLGDKIYIYTTDYNPKFYGAALYQQVIERYGRPMIYLCTAHKYTKEQLYGAVYPDCFIGLRLVDHDGLSETVAELGLMGRRVVYNGQEPNALTYTGIDDVIRHIDSERERIGCTNRLTARMMKQFLAIGKQWLDVRWY